MKHYGRSSVSPSFILKIGMRKAYDTMEWDFLEDMLLALGLLARFTHLIMVCVTSPKFSLMVNGSLHGYFASKGGLGQGDPLSPLLFDVWMEYISRILKKISIKLEFDFHPRCFLPIFILLMTCSCVAKETFNLCCCCNKVSSFSLTL